jgi:20S proteasome alpha/beta subunit
MSIMAYNGGCVVAMKGKDCVAIATDHRFGLQVRPKKIAESSRMKIKNAISISGTNHRNQL